MAVTAAQQARPGAGDIPADVLALAAEIEHVPRHLGIHSGGMVICDRPIVEVCPVEWARMEDRSVLQWDKDDCAAVGLVKFDLLGLGMLEALHGAFDHVAATHGQTYDLATIPTEDPAVYDMLCRADSVGVFQVESRAQMATLPRLQPRHFYDLVVEIALIRPGPIQGGSVHPYIRRRKQLRRPPPTSIRSWRRASRRPWACRSSRSSSCRSPSTSAGSRAGEADQLRQAMGSKRSRERMEQLHRRFVDGALAQEVTPEVAEQIWEKLAAFASYGFPESHSVSFAYLVYASSWLKRYYPAAFCRGAARRAADGLLRAAHPRAGRPAPRRRGAHPRPQRLRGHHHPRTWRRRGGRSGPARAGRRAAGGVGARRAGGAPGPGVGAGHRRRPRRGDRRGGHGRRPLRRPGGPRLAACRSPSPSSRPSPWPAPSTASGCPDGRRCGSAGAAAQVGTGRSGALHLPGITTGLTPPVLRTMTPAEEGRADLWATGVSPEGHPTRFVRAHLDALGVVTATGLAAVEAGERVLVAGVVTHRQRPATAGGTMFVNLEDETGLINVVVSVGCWHHHLQVARAAPAMLVRGRLERAEGVTNVIADRLEPLPLDAKVKSRDFR